tara:strand:- start:6313 stop:6576 length:264 start_codon:yes stop_codon:yes gene_type:complete
MSEKIILEIEVDFKEGTKTIQSELKQPFDIEECEEGKYVVLSLLNGENYSGFYRGMDDQTIMLESLNRGQTIGLEFNWLDNYLEQTD